LTHFLWSLKDTIQWEKRYISYRLATYPGFRILLAYYVPFCTRIPYQRHYLIYADEIAFFARHIRIEGWVNPDPLAEALTLNHINNMTVIQVGFLRHTGSKPE
jgi:hypothetical protein